MCGMRNIVRDSPITAPVAYHSHRQCCRISLAAMDEGDDEERQFEAADDAEALAREKQRITFVPDEYWNSKGGRRSRRTNTGSTEARMLSLFSEIDIHDPITSYVSTGEGSFDHRKREPEPFNLVPSEFLAKARRLRPIKPEPTASSFSSWIYSLYSQAIGKEEERERGKEVEQEVLDRRRAAFQCIDNKYLRKVVSNWALIRNGIEQPEDRPIDYLTIDHLRVGGVPLRVSPDLMYQNRALSKVLIVEIKHTKMFVPTNLWPNVWAQLWCYSQIEVARQADSVGVIGEVWCDEWTRGYRVKGGREPGKCHIMLRASVRRDPRAISYDRFFRQLFEIYSGSPVPVIEGDRANEHPRM